MHHYGKTWQKIFKESYAPIRSRVIDWRHGSTLERIERPSRLDRARALGYKSKQGFVVVRAKVSRGGMRRPRPKAGRRPKHLGVVKMKANVNVKQTSERRVGEKYPNLKVLNSYFVYKDGRHVWHEVILVDLNHPSVRSGLSTHL
ncbi:MAG: 50S ribosomal protein L15e [Nitrososphaerales archaeon]